MISRNCRRCKLCLTRKNMVIGRGSIPADILFIGEGPGKVEDATGQPFTGPSGKVLDAAIEQSSNMFGFHFPDYYITNLIMCRPTDTINGPNRVPTDQEIKACYSNLRVIFENVCPDIVITLGKTAEKSIIKSDKVYNIKHPAYILRQGGIESPQFLSYARELADILEKEF